MLLAQTTRESFLELYRPSALFISALAGAIIPVALVDKMTVKRAIALILVGLLTSFYLAPFLCYLAGWTDKETCSAVGFIVGLIGCQLSQAIIRWGTAERLQGIVGKSVGGLLGRSGLSSDQNPKGGQDGREGPNPPL